MGSRRRPVQYPGDDVRLVFGERTGIPPGAVDLLDVAVETPMAGAGASLPAVVAALDGFIVKGRPEHR